MILINTCSRLAIKRIIPVSTQAFAGDSWKDRDEAAEKVYINRKQRQTLKKLLNQIDEQSIDKENSSHKFDGKLDEIMKRYKIQNEALRAEISHLHRDLRSQ